MVALDDIGVAVPMAIADALSTDEVRVIFGECHVDVLDLVWIIR